MILLNKLLEDGNTLYRKSRFAEAAHRYTYALRRVPTTQQQQQHPDRQQVYEQLQMHLLLNLSRSRRKLGEAGEAVRRASEALKLRPECTEALLARARALREEGDLESAMADLQQCVRLAPEDREAGRLACALREDLRTREDNNNVKAGAPVGAGEKFSFVDEAEEAPEK